MIKITPEALEAVPYGLIVVALDKSIVFINQAAHSFFARRGLNPGNSLHTLQSALHLFDAAHFDAAKESQIAADRWPVALALRGETVEPAEFAARTVPLRTALWLECGASPLRGDDGATEGAIFTIHEITRRKKRQLALESADYLRDFIYNGNVAGILHTTIDGRVIDCNEAIVHMLGFNSKEELRATRAPQFYYDPLDRDRMLNLIRVSRQLGDFEICFRRRDNSRCWGLSNIRMMDSPAGEVGGALIATVVDITQRKLWEETLRQSEERFSAFMRHLPGVAFIKDRNGRYVYFSETSQRLLGKQPAEFIGKTDSEIWSPEDAEIYRASDAGVIEAGQPVEVTEPNHGHDGTHSWLVYKFPIMEDGKVVFVAGIGIDITERRALEEQLTQSRRMEALGRLAGGVAHDFNNVLTVISGYGQLALEGLDNTPAERLTMYLQEILSSARRAVGLTGQLLAFSRRQVVEPKVLDLPDLLRGIERLLQRMIGENVELTLRCGYERCLIRADAHQIEQVMMNMAANARDAMPLGGNLEIDCRVLPEPRERPGRVPLGVIVEVRDTGVGMDENVRSQLFEPFFSSKEKARGTGLGLATAYGVITQADGEIEVESKPGHGSVFRIYFPQATGEVEAVTPVVSEAANSRRAVVLLVEDDESVRKLTTTMLGRLGYRVVSADGGAAAIEIWKERGEKIDILLTDVIMPHMSGSQLANKLREMEPGLKVLFMSGYTDDRIAGHGVLHGETQLIPKPFSSRDLARKLRAVLDA